jgi:hypothetical protein
MPITYGGTRNRGFAHVEFADSDTVIDEVIEEYQNNGFFLDGRKLRLDYAQRSYVEKDEFEFEPNKGGRGGDRGGGRGGDRGGGRGGGGGGDGGGDGGGGEGE